MYSGIPHLSFNPLLEIHHNSYTQRCERVGAYSFNPLLEILSVPVNRGEAKLDIGDTFNPLLEIPRAHP